MSQKALYPYTLQPVALDMSDADFRAAQLALFEKSAQSIGLKHIRTKEWIVLGLLVVASIAGLIFVRGYSTILFWILIIGAIAYVVARTAGLKWYMRREFDKQVMSATIPEQLHKMKLGVQSHGLIMSLPIDPASLQSPQMRGMSMRAAPMQQAVIPWHAVSSWDDTQDYIFILFEMQGQQGSQIIPKRLKDKGLPTDTIIKHLGEARAKGLSMDNISSL